jgi:hypothetical protein
LKFLVRAADLRQGCVGTKKKNPPTGIPAVGAYSEELAKSYKISDLTPEHTGSEAEQHVQLVA